MGQVVSIEDVRPSPRYDSQPWTNVLFQEGTADVGPWADLGTISLSPVDLDPANPAYRDFTVDNAGTASSLWYRLVFRDAQGDTGLPTFPMQNVPDDRPVYASASELALVLRVNATQRHASLMRVLKSAASEIDSEIGTVDVNGDTLPYSNAPALAREVNIERAVEHWQQQQSPFGIIGVGDTGATYTARDSWDRHAHKLAPLKATWGLA
jgi:hypothetical protein